MIKMKQKATSLVLTIALLISMIPMVGLTSFAEGELVAYSDGKSLFSDAECTTPVTVKSSITDIVFKDGVTAITKFDEFSFRKNLTTVKIPSSVTLIDNNTLKFRDVLFEFCRKLTSIIVDPENANYASIDGVLYTKDLSQLVRCPEGKSGEFVIPSSVTAINYGAFYHCANLTNIIIPKGVTEISDSAFHSCNSLTKVAIPEGVTSISRLCFLNCLKLQSVILPKGLTSIKDLAFNSCGKLQNIEFPMSLEFIGTKAFEGCSSLTNITLPSSTKKQDSSVFFRCKNLVQNIISVDAATGIQVIATYGLFPDNSRLVVKDESNDNSVFAQIDEVWRDILQRDRLYNICIVDKDGNEIEPKGDVTVRIPIPAGYDKAELEALRINEGADTKFVGKLVTIDGKDYYEFTTNHFSNYALIDKDMSKVNATNTSSTSSPKTGDNTPIVAVCVIAIMSMGAIAFSLKRRTLNVK